MGARAATASKVIECARRRGHGRLVRPGARCRRSCRGRSVHDLVEPFDELAVAGGFVGPSALLGVGGQGGGVGALRAEHGKEAVVTAEVGAVFADVGVGADTLSLGAQAITAARRALISGASRQSPGVMSVSGNVVRCSGSTGPRRLLASSSAR